jgi:cytochrome c oxidase cbb3-type subunit 1
VLVILPLIALVKVFAQTVSGTKVECKGGPYCYAKFGTVIFIISTLMTIPLGCPHFGRTAGQTWYVPALEYLQLFGFFAIVVCGGIYELLPRIMDFELPFPKFVRFQHWCYMIGVAFLVVPLAVGGVVQGLKMQDPNIAFVDIVQGTLMYLRVSTLGLALLLVGSLMLAANIFSMIIRWKLGLVKSVLAAVQAPLETQEVKS